MRVGAPTRWRCWGGSDSPVGPPSPAGTTAAAGESAPRAQLRLTPCLAGGRSPLTPFPPPARRLSPEAAAAQASVQAAAPLPPPAAAVAPGAAPLLITVSAREALIALVAAATFAISGCVSVFILVMVPTLKARGRTRPCDANTHRHSPFCSIN